MSATPSTLSRLQELLPQLFQATKLPGDLYLRCELTSEVTGLISMEYVRESLLVPGEQITPLPKMSPFVMGLMNSRDRVFLALDLLQLLGLSSLSIHSRQYHIIVINVSPFFEEQSDSEQELWLGLVVNRIQGITRVIADQIRSPQEMVDSTFAPYLQGWVRTEEQQLPILNLATIVKKTL